MNARTAMYNNLNLITIMLQLQIIGNLTKDAETRVIGDGTYAAFSVAMNVSKEQAVFVNVRKRIGDNAGGFMQYLTKGKKVFAQGSMSVQTYLSKQTNETIIDITLWADKIEFVGGGEKQEGAAAF